MEEDDAYTLPKIKKSTTVEKKEKEQIDKAIKESMKD